MNCVVSQIMLNFNLSCNVDRAAITITIYDIPAGYDSGSVYELV